ncbi:uracil-DNA glycosylase [Azorhizobium oxalatiphilum]|uniref:Type-4 uracil-DNA glycosylase n=1 Tax=Azorhizobium oxalatiphilum TaxID=980631 RepID=A0A917BQH2_9HYPH|nr:UdgX family uracil-DNA binding protein [Azorhizobium oxalatiphilum]GGF54927.1 uracil-DNA glycosylase [Azorhizobium oxalatiphilum]
MLHVTLESETDFEGWRRQARALVRRGVRPRDVVWSPGGTADLFGGGELPEMGEGQGEAAAFTVPRAFVELAETVVLHADPQRFARLYNLLFRLRETPRLMELAIDPDVARLQAMAKSVRRDIHKMRAFVRFRRVELEGVEWFVSWFEPEHHILKANAPFFRRRFAGMNFSILTPEASAHWDGVALSFGPGATRAEAPTDDALEELWRGYYASIFNPARLKISAMKSEMAVKYWHNLPEAQLIAPLIADAQRRTVHMMEEGATAPNARPHKPAPQVAEPVPQDALAAARAEAASCRACPLWAPATQTVFGAGPVDAPVMFVGEQPGDQEDLDGRPFVGPAGKMFDRAAQEAGLERARAYVTNAVKHFKFVPRGKRRIHQSPAVAEIRACRPWLMRELELVRPKLVVAMGATAAQAVFGKAMPVGKNRGRLLALEDGRQALITVHPSYLLRLPDAAAQAEEYARFVEDLKLARPFLAV